MKKEKKVRIVMDVPESIKKELEEYAKKCGWSLTLYLMYCGLHEQPKAMPPEEIVRAKNLMCNFQSQLLLIDDSLEDVTFISPYLRECRKIIKDMDRLLLDVQH